MGRRFLGVDRTFLLFWVVLRAYFLTRIPRRQNQFNGNKGEPNSREVGLGS
jgi:hypothetical protein